MNEREQLRELFFDYPIDGAGYESTGIHIPRPVREKDRDNLQVIIGTVNFEELID